ncbi:MAG: hypothetical protein V2A76_16440 [Planctomycetota bacterium]
MKRRALLLLLPFVAPGGSLFGQAVAGPRQEPLPGWEELGPAPIANGSYAGRVSAIACSRTDSNRIFVGGADGGVWRTPDGGLTWQQLAQEMPTTAVGALALDSSDEAIVYVGTGEANYANHSRYGLGLYKSQDGGETWQHLAESTFAGRCFSRLQVDPQNGQIVYGALTRAGGFPELAAAKGHPGATGDLGVFKSTDGGMTWNRLTGGLPNLSATDLVLDPNNPQRLFAAIGRIFGNSQNGIYRSTNGGSSWTKLTSGLPSSTVGRISLALAPSDSNRLYALITNPCDSSGGGADTRGGYKSVNGGNSWTSVPVGSIQSTYGWYLSTVLVHPTNADTVFMGGLNLLRSTNGGSSFSTVTPPHVDLHALSFDAAGRLLAGDDGGVHRSTNNGNSWVSINDGLGTIQLYAGLSSHPSDDDIFLGGMQDNGSNRRDTNSLLWTQVFGGDGGWTQLDQANPSRMFVEYQGTANLYLSTDGGWSFNWSGSGVSSYDRNCFLPPFLIDPADSNRMLYGTHRVYRSLNGGSSWSVLSGDLTNGSGAIRSLAISPADSNVVWAATNDGNLQVSVSGGANFTRVLSGLPGWPRNTREIFCHPADASCAWLAVAAFGTAQIRKTENLGQSWTDQDQALPDVPVNAVAVLPGVADQIFAGTDSGLYESRNGGVSFSRYGHGLPNAPVIDLLLEPDRGRLVVSTQGRGVWRTRLAPIRR